MTGIKRNLALIQDYQGLIHFGEGEGEIAGFSAKRWDRRSS